MADEIIDATEVDVKEVEMERVAASDILRLLIENIELKKQVIQFQNQELDRQYMAYIQNEANVRDFNNRVVNFDVVTKEYILRKE